jgi:hypothetical protein
MLSMKIEVSPASIDDKLLIQRMMQYFDNTQ